MPPDKVGPSSPVLRPLRIASKAPAKKAPAKRPPRKGNNPHGSPPVADDPPAKAPAKKAAKKAPVKAPAKKVTPDRRHLHTVTEMDIVALEAAIEAAVEEYEGEVIDPAYRAHLMRLAGRPWPEVAQRCGFISNTAAAQAVVAFFQQAAMERGREIAAFAFDTEMERLETMLSWHWDSASRGDIDATKMLLSIIAQRGKWQGFEREIKVSDNRTIIIQAGDHMAADLEAAAREAHPHLRIGAAPEVIDVPPVEG